MKVRYIQDEDFTNYRECSMFIATPYCSFKCEKDCGIQCCQNSPLAKAPLIDISVDALIQRYLKNPFSKAVVLGGLEPMDTFDETLEFCKQFRHQVSDTIVIYTGYYPEEIEDKLSILKELQNIVIKFGRYIPNSSQVYDPVLKVVLASANQFAKKIS